MITNEQLKKFAEDCVGRGDISIQGAFGETFPDEDFDDLTAAQFALFDSIVFACNKCGWLCGSDEVNSYNGEAYCDDCYNDEEMDDWEDEESEYDDQDEYENYDDWEDEDDEWEEDEDDEE